jgi:hypothetical protein
MKVGIGQVQQVGEDAPPRDGVLFMDHMAAAAGGAHLGVGWKRLGDASGANCHHKHMAPPPSFCTPHELRYAASRTHRGEGMRAR